MPLAAVIIPAYNAATTLGRCLDSIAAAIDLAVARLATKGVAAADIVPVVVDDASTDDTRATLRQWAESRRRAVLYRGLPVNRGPSACRNAGVAAVDADLLFFLDADDDFAPEHLWLCLTLMGLFKGVGAVRTGILLEQPIHPAWERALVRSWVNNLCVRRDAHDRIGGFDERLRTTEDAEYSSRLVALTSTVTVPRRTVWYRWSPGNNLDRQLERWSQPPDGVQPEVTPEIAAARRRHGARLDQVLAAMPQGEVQSSHLVIQGDDAAIDALAALPLRFSVRTRTCRRGEKPQGSLAEQSEDVMVEAALPWV